MNCFSISKYYNIRAPVSEKCLLVLFCQTLQASCEVTPSSRPPHPSVWCLHYLVNHLRFSLECAGVENFDSLIIPPSASDLPVLESMLAWMHYKVVCIAVTLNWIHSWIVIVQQPLHNWFSNSSTNWIYCSFRIMMVVLLCRAHTCILHLFPILNHV